MSTVTHEAGQRLRSIVDRIERLEEERKALGSDIKDIYSEAKSAGFDVKVLRRLIRERKIDPATLEEMETLLDVYKHAIEKFETTPLAEASNPRDITDDIYEGAVRIVLQARKASASFVQRGLGVGYNTAAQMIERMEREGIISAAKWDMLRPEVQDIVRGTKAVMRTAESPALRKAVKAFVDGVNESGHTVTISAGAKSVRVGKNAGDGAHE